MAKLDIDLVRHALTTARENGIIDVRLNLGEDSFSATLKPGKPDPKPQLLVHEELAAPVDQTIPVKATLVGFYREAKTPLTVGQIVEKGTPIAVIAALGIANDIEAPASGEVIEVLIKADQPVMYGQVLARIKP